MMEALWKLAQGKVDGARDVPLLILPRLPNVDDVGALLDPLLGFVRSKVVVRRVALEGVSKHCQLLYSSRGNPA
jgi:hypothetical protein